MCNRNRRSGMSHSQTPTTSKNNCRNILQQKENMDYGLILNFVLIVITSLEITITKI